MFVYKQMKRDVSDVLIVRMKLFWVVVGSQHVHMYLLPVID